MASRRPSSTRARSSLPHCSPGARVTRSRPFRSEADYEAWFRRLRRYPAFLDDAARVMREGMASGVTTPRVLAERALSQLEGLAPEDVAKSALWKPMTQFPAAIDA